MVEVGTMLIPGVTQGAALVGNREANHHSVHVHDFYGRRRIYRVACYNTAAFLISVQDVTWSAQLTGQLSSTTEKKRPGSQRSGIPHVFINL